MYPFNYHRPGSVAEARALLDSSDDAMLLAGGMTLLPTMKLRLARPSDLVDLGGIEELNSIEDSGRAIERGALVRYAYDTANARVMAALATLARLAGRNSDQQVRNRGTLVDSIANSDPASDDPAAVLALN